MALWKTAVKWPQGVSLYQIQKPPEMWLILVSFLFCPLPFSFILLPAHSLLQKLKKFKGGKLRKYSPELWTKIQVMVKMRAKPTFTLAICGLEHCTMEQSFCLCRISYWKQEFEEYQGRDIFIFGLKKLASLDAYDRQLLSTFMLYI